MKDNYPSFSDDVKVKTAKRLNKIIMENEEYQRIIKEDIYINEIKDKIIVNIRDWQKKSDFYWDK